MKRVVSGAVVVMMMLVLVACGGGGDKSGENPVVGLWKLTDGAVGGKTMTISSLDEMMGTTLSTMTIELQANGKAVVSVEMSGEKLENKGDWEQDGDTITVTTEAETLDCTYDADKGELSTLSQGATLIFKK